MQQQEDQSGFLQHDQIQQQHQQQQQQQQQHDLYDQQHDLYDQQQQQQPEPLINQDNYQMEQMIQQQ